MSESKKQILVTGGSRGLGRAMVERFARDGARVVFSYRSDATAAEEVVQAVRAAGGEAVAVQADLSSVDGVGGLFARLDEVFDGLDAVVANAGIIQDKGFDEVTEDDFDALFDLNVKGVFFTVQEALRRMRDGGRVVLLGTGLTRFTMPQYVTYAAAKAALDALAKGLAKTVGPRGITVNVLAPGAIDTDMNPWLRTPEGSAAMRSMTALDRVGHAEDIADAAAALLSEDARWITGQRIEASGGMNL